MEALKTALPGYAKDQRLNLSALLADTVLTPHPRWATLLAAALAARHAAVTPPPARAATAHLPPAAGLEHLDRQQVGGDVRHSQRALVRHR